jgi:hypothetical protein
MTVHETISALRDLTALPPAECHKQLIATVEHLQATLDAALDAEAEAHAGAFDAATRVSVDGEAPISWAAFLTDTRMIVSVGEVEVIVEDLRAEGVCFFGSASIGQVWLA